MTYTRQKTKKKKEPESLGVEDATPKTKRGQVRGSSSLRGKEQMIKVEDNAVLEESEELQGIDFGDSEEVSF